MSSYTPNTDLWLERSRLNGMLLSAVSYGIYFLLTVQATIALIQKRNQSIRHRTILLVYVGITFVLGTLGFAGNSRYTQMIWIDLRDAPGGPATLILDEMDYRINVMSLTCYYIMEWFMQALLLHRCFVVWEWKKYIMIPMTTIFIAMVAMSILVLGEATGAVFYNINSQLAYLCLQVGLTLIYTLLVAGRLFSFRKRMHNVLGKEHVRAYEIAAAMVIESGAIYSAVGILFIVTFALHSYICNLVFLSVSNIQGIAELLIIIRIARGQASHQTSMSSSRRPTHLPSSITFANTASSKHSDAMLDLDGMHALENGSCRSTGKR